MLGLGVPLLDNRDLLDPNTDTQEAGPLQASAQGVDHVSSFSTGLIPLPFSLGH